MKAKKMEALLHPSTIAVIGRGPDGISHVSLALK